MAVPDCSPLPRHAECLRFARSATLLRGAPAVGRKIEDVYVNLLASRAVGSLARTNEHGARRRMRSAVFRYACGAHDVERGRKRVGLGAGVGDNRCSVYAIGGPAGPRV